MLTKEELTDYDKELIEKDPGIFYEFNTGRYTLITDEKPNFPIPEFYDIFVGDIDKAIQDIKSIELSQERMYSGHVIIKEMDGCYYNILHNIKDLNIGFKDLLVTLVYQTGVDSECYVKDDIVVCNSWVLPVVQYNVHSNNNLYGDAIARRLNIKVFDI